MSELFSLPGSSKPTSVSPTAFWLSQGILLAATIGGIVAIVSKLETQSARAAELAGRLQTLEHQVARLAEKLEALRNTLAEPGAVAAPTRSRSTRAQRSTSNSAEPLNVEGVPTQAQTSVSSTKKKPGPRRTKKSNPDVDDSADSSTQTA